MPAKSDRESVQAQVGAFDLYRLTLCASTMFMLILSWPLWMDGSDFPRVPFVRGFPQLPAWVSWTVMAMVLGLLAASSGSVRRDWQGMVGGSLPLLALAIAGDQNRCQPWIYQYLVIGLAIAFTSRRRGWALARLYTISVYFYSGLSKLDISFVNEVGATFLETAVSPLGLTPSSWPRAVQVGLILLMPAWEVAVAVGLLFRKTRRWATVGAMAQHLALLGILGPWGLGHSSIVLVWNAAMMAEVWLLFWPEIDGQGVEGLRKLLDGSISIVIAFVLTWPMFERVGLCDSWPGHALYASHAERTEVFIHEDDATRFPEAVVRRLGPAAPDSYRRLDLTGWSRDVRGTPLYPQGRVANGVAEALAEGFGTIHPLRVILWTRAGVGNGRRDRVECLGLGAIRRHGQRYWINAHPRNGGKFESLPVRP